MALEHVTESELARTGKTTYGTYRFLGRNCPFFNRRCDNEDQVEMKKLFVLVGVLFLGGCAAMADRELTDLEQIDRLHGLNFNDQWEPEKSLDDSESQHVRLQTMSPRALPTYCGSDALACTVPSVDKDFAETLNKLPGRPEDLIPFQIEDCVIVMPIRYTKYPRLWFYLLGHEFAHCKYGNFHPDSTNYD